MTTLYDVMYEHLGDTSVHNIKKLESYTLLYLFRFLSSKEYTQVLVTYFPDSIASERLAFRQAIQEDGYIMFNLKLFVFRIVCSGVTSSQYFTAKAIANQYEILEDDIELLECLNLNTKKGSLHKNLLSYKERYKCHTLNDLHKNLSALIEELNPYINKFYYVKLRFTSSTTGMTQEDIISELKTYAIQKVYFMYPVIESRLHCLNIMKRVIRQHGLNMIQSVTKKKRAILYKDDKGNIQSSNVSLSLLSDYVDTEVMSAFCVGLTGSVDCDHDLRYSVKQIYDTSSKKKKLFINLLSGKSNLGFTNYLIENNIIRETLTNEDYVEHSSTKEYLSSVVSYLGINLNDAYSFMNTLGECLVGRTAIKNNVSSTRPLIKARL